MKLPEIHWPSLFDRPHWEIEGLNDAERALRGCVGQFPAGSWIGLWGGDTEDLRIRFARLRLHPTPAGRSLLLRDGLCLRAEDETFEALADFASGHAAPELACHLFVVGPQAPLLEWFDLPDDALVLTGEWNEPRAQALAAALGGELRRREGRAERIVQGRSQG
jgi:hypothetical protein